MQIVFKSAADILTESLDTNWIVNPFLTPGGSMMVYGRQGVGKSSLLLQLAAAIAHQGEWLAFPTGRAGPTAFLELDMPRIELRFLLERADQELFVNGTRAAVRFPTFWDDDVETYDFDVLRDADYGALMEAILDVKPVLLVVDTINEAYHRREKRTGGEELRQAIRRLRSLTEAVAGGTVYLQHKRKRQGGTSGDDPDAFLGAVELEAVASASLELQRTTDEDEPEQRFALIVRKCRVGTAGFQRLDLGRDPQGFFVPIWGATSALARWPYCLPPGERPSRPFARAEVLKVLEERLGLQHEALKKACQRTVGKFAWEER